MLTVSSGLALHPLHRGASTLVVTVIVRDVIALPLVVALAPHLLAAVAIILLAKMIVGTVTTTVVTVIVPEVPMIGIGIAI